MTTRQAAVTAALRRARLIPVIVIDDPKNAVPLASALLDGGLPIAEITLRTPRALEALRRIADEKPEMNAGDLIADLILERQAQKAAIRNSFKPSSDASEEERW